MTTTDDNNIELSRVPETGWLPYIRDFGRAGAEALLEKFPPVSVYRAAVEYVTKKEEERCVEEFFRLVAQHSQAEHQIELLVDVANGMDTPQVYQAVAEGYKQMRDCVDEAAKPCLAVLISQHMYSTGPSTAYFRAAAQVLGSSESSQLRDLRGLTNAYEEARIIAGDREVLSATIVGCHVKQDGAEAQTTWVSLWCGTEHRIHSAVRPDWTTRKHLQNVLVSTGFCQSIDGLTYEISREGARGSAWLEIAADRLVWFSALGRCFDALGE